MKKNFYKSFKDIGNHENFLTKIGDENSGIFTYRVVFVSNNSAEIEYNGIKEPLKVGTVLGANAIIKTNFSRVEIVNQNNDIFRLDLDSEFCIEKTIEGYVPVYYGDIYFQRGLDNTIKASHKYRTSCWTSTTNPFAIIRINDNRDAYYSFENEYEIYEYDEKGNKFTIVKLEKNQKCILEFDFTKNMKSRYKVVSLEDTSKNEIEEIYKNYVMPLKWNEKYKEEAKHKGLNKENII